MVYSSDTLFYVLNLLIFDPRVLGPDHPGAAVMLLLILIWGLYLVSKLAQIRAPGLALRYAIPCVGCAWLLIESAAAMRLFREIWLEPFEFPVVMSAWAMVSAGLFLGYARLGQRPATPLP